MTKPFTEEVIPVITGTKCRESISMGVFETKLHPIGRKK